VLRPGKEKVDEMRPKRENLLTLQSFAKSGLRGGDGLSSMTGNGVETNALRRGIASAALARVECVVE